jgi:hypothetical protein
MSAHSNHALYLYGFTQPDRAPQGLATARLEAAGSPADSAGPPADGDALGSDGPPAAFLWEHAGLSAILSSVPQEEFCGPAAEANLRNLAWVGPRALRHQAVLEAAMRLAPILPARFGTLYSSLPVLGQFMERQRETILGFLQRVSQQSEWAVKGLLDRARAEETLCRRKPAGAKTAPVSLPGLAYLRDQQGRLQARRELEDRLAEACHKVVDELALLASETCARPVLVRETSGADQEMIVNWAFLVPQRATAQFPQRVEQASASQALPGLTFTVSGPWPPYSFCPPLPAELG